MANVDKLVEQVSSILFGKGDIPDQDKLRNIVSAQANVMCLTDGFQFSPGEIDAAIGSIQTRHITQMGLGVLFEAEDYRPWLDQRRGEIDFYYWSRYHKHLKERFLSKEVVGALDLITDKILDHLEDPTKEGKWERKGLVVGHVQSGKTANYIGLIAKAADAGYKVVIVLGGMLNSLRNQTQSRIDADFMGFCTRYQKHMGVARFGSARRPISFTTSISDFSKKVAQQIALGLDALREPVILVVKKHVSTLAELKNWLAENNRHNLKEFPLLLIDDEADHASINTKKSEQDPTAINRGIRELLQLFPRSSFVGYTATPFANIFIDPENVNEMTNGELYKDLFPRDFILSLDPPTNYFGATEVFIDKPDTYLRTIDDSEDLLPIRHKKDWEPSALPESLKKAVDCYIIGKAIRLLRGQTNKHYSMMINVSRFTNVQERLKTLVSIFVKERQDAIKNYAGLPPEIARKNSAVLERLWQVWAEEYAENDALWHDVQGKLNESASPISIASINVNSTDRLDYDEFPNGRSLIAIGGLGLSRGLTLEGLLVSYFLRNSIMYDTLLQMGRWFGYRDGYADLCRIFMPESAASWYAHIAEAVEELRSDFKEMERLKLTPLEFGLRVRSHPTALIVTARNKMRSATPVIVEIALEGRLVETSLLINRHESITHNGTVLNSAVIQATRYSKWEREPNNLGGYLCRSVPISILETVVESFQNAPECMLTEKGPLLNYIYQLRDDKNITTCDVLLRSVPENDEFCIECAGLEVFPFKRTLANSTMSEPRLEFTKRHIISPSDEQAGLTPEEVASIDAAYKQANPEKKRVAGSAYRKHKDEHGIPPLLMLMFASVACRNNENKRLVVPAYGISFPGSPGASRRPERLVQYQVNKVYRDKFLADSVNEEEDEE